MASDGAISHSPLQGRPYKILALDGGGAWSILQVMALQKIYGEAAEGHQVLADFAIAAANSGGSIVLAGLIENKTLSEIYSYFKSSDIRETIFEKKGFLSTLPNRLFGTEPAPSSLHWRVYSLPAATCRSAP